MVENRFFFSKTNQLDFTATRGHQNLGSADDSSCAIFFKALRGKQPIFFPLRKLKKASARGLLQARAL
jgi:hypothetical protein